MSLELTFRVIEKTENVFLIFCIFGNFPTGLKIGEFEELWKVLVEELKIEKPSYKEAIKVLQKASLLNSR